MNIVFAFADDCGRYASIYDHLDGGNTINALIDTPNIDRIGMEGVTFRRAVVPAPSCTPCRSAVCSGRYFFQTGRGAILSGAVWDTDIPTYPLELEKNGYHIGHTNKVWSPGENRNAPYGGERTAYNRHGKSFGRFSIMVTKALAEMEMEEAKETMYNECRQNFRDFLNDRKDNTPFCYWWGPTNTHRVWEKGSGKNLWNINPDNLKGKLPKSLPDVPEVREDFADYLGEVMAFDKSVGVLIQELERIGELDNTLFVVSGDHGIPGMPRGKCNLYSLGYEVSLMMRYPSVIKSGRVVDDVVNIMDLAPTFLDMAEVSIPEGMTAKSLKNLLLSNESGQIEKERTFAVIGRERHVDSARDGYLPYPQRAICTKDYLYIINFEPDRWPMGSPYGLDEPDCDITYEQLQTNSNIVFPDMDASPTKAWVIWNRNHDEYKEFYHLGMGKRPKAELYDLRKDKSTINNVAYQLEYLEIKEELHNKLMNTLVEQNDYRVTEQDCRFEKYPYTNMVGPELRKGIAQPDWYITSQGKN